jgi:hypothetical protein
MLSKRRAAATKVAQSLWAAEDALDAALARAAELSGTLASARIEANLSAIVAQDAFDGAAAALSAIAKARGELVETHRCLTQARIDLGLRAVAVGDEPVKPMTGQAKPHLQAVA